MNAKQSATILANDPSFTAWGWAVLDNNKVVDKGCIKTSPENKARRIRKGDDTVRRIHEIATFLSNIIDKHNVRFVISELPHGSQTASAAVMIGAVTGIMQTICTVKNIAIDWYSEADAKKHLLNRRSATKQETINAIDKLYAVKWTKIKYKDEAIADALAVYHVARSQSAAIKLLLPGNF